MPQFAVLHIQKGKGSGGGLGSHIDRSRKVLNADPEKTKDNLHVIQEVGKVKLVNQALFEARQIGKLSELVEGRISKGYKGKKAIRKDAVKYLNVVLTGSHERMKEVEGDGKHLKNWIKDNYNFACKEFGKENVVRFAVHRDERTMHIHCTVVPLTEDGRLSAKEVMGNRTKMSDRQTVYAEEMKKYGLSRGIKGSTATHEEVSEYYARLENPVKAEISLPKKKFFENDIRYHERVEKSLEPLILAKKGHEKKVDLLKDELEGKDDRIKLFQKKLQNAEWNFLKEQQRSEKLALEKEKNFDYLLKIHKDVARGDYTQEKAIQFIEGIKKKKEEKVRETNRGKSRGINF